MIYLLDTDTLIYLVRGLKLVEPESRARRERLQRAQRILAHCRKHQSDGDPVGLSAITVAELEYGARHSGDYAREIAAVQKILTPFALYNFDAHVCALHYGEVRHGLEAAGEIIGAMDLLIASHAKALSATLVTNDTRHFTRVPGLLLENWSN